MTHRPDPQLFADPPGTYRPVPFWFWNGDMEEAEIDRQLREMKDKGVIEAFIHARKGLQIPYLSQEWFDRVGFTIRKASEYGMRMWLYDEDNWPSGYAGGRVMQADPNCRAKNLAREVVSAEGGASISMPVPEGKLVSVLAREVGGGESIDITGNISDGNLEWAAPSGSWEISFLMQRYGHWKAAYTEDYYVDLIDTRCVSEFIRTTHEEYFSRFGSDFGGTVAGIFTDEPGFYANLWGYDDGTNTWTDDFLSEFHKEKGYDLRPHLISLWENTGNFRRIRADYYDVLSTLFRDRYFLQIMDWCVAHGVESIGHITIEEELKLNARMVGDFFRSMEYLTIPGIDEITQMRQDPDIITPKLGSSSAHIFGRERCMSETFGVYGWRLSLAEMKWVTDWQFVRGVNLLVPHAFYYSIEGERREECPPSEFYQNIWWKYFRHYADYVGRLGYLNTLGHHVADTAVYYPISSIWAEITPVETTVADEIGAHFKNVSSVLLSNQRDFDYLNDDAIRSAEVRDGRLCLRDEEYWAFVIPAATVMAVDIMQILARFCRSGGTLIVNGELPAQAVLNGSDEELAEIFDSLAKDPGEGTFRRTSSDTDVLAALDESILPDVILDSDRPTVNYLHRRLDDTDIYFLANRSPETIVLHAGFRSAGVPMFWDAENGTVSPVLAYSHTDGYTSIPLEISGYGSRHIVFSPGEHLPHVVAGVSDLLEVSAQSVRARVRREGEYYADIESGDEVTRVRGVAADLPPAVDLNDGWSLRTEEDMQTRPVGLGSWTEQGLADYSGSATYAIEFELDVRYLGRPLLLEMGVVHESAEVLVNGRSAGVRLWWPYTVDIGGLVREGSNHLDIIVTNTLANRFEGQSLPSGLLGPVTIIPIEEIVLE